jgi:hypothetical protein
MLNIDRHARAVIPAGSPPLMIVVVDAEEEFDWSKPFSRDATATTSIADQERGHEVFDDFGIVPTYAVDHPVATGAEAALLVRLRREGRCDIAAHLHPWVNPPFVEPLTARNSYPGNLPPELERQKLIVLMDAIETRFGERPTVYKAGRYGVGPATAGIIEALGFRVDLSVVPHSTFGDDGGPDFSRCSGHPYWCGAGQRLLEIPLSRAFVGVLAPSGPWLHPLLHRRLPRRLGIAGAFGATRLLERITLGPEEADGSAHIRLLRQMVRDGHRIFTVAYHSTWLGLGKTPHIRTEAERRAFLARLRRICRYFRDELGGAFTTPLAAHDLLSRARAATLETLTAEPLAARSAGPS